MTYVIIKLCMKLVTSPYDIKVAISYTNDSPLLHDLRHQLYRFN